VVGENLGLEVLHALAPEQVHKAGVTFCNRAV
jgi:hypothetical protein